MHIGQLTSAPDVVEMVLQLSQFLYKILVGEAVPQELLSMVLKLFGSPEMLPFYKTEAFRTQMRQMISIVLLQVRLRTGFYVALVQQRPDDADCRHDLDAVRAGPGIDSRYTINFSDFAPFYRTDLPLFLESVPGLQKENRERLLWGGETVTDMPSFQSFIRKMMKDIHIYSNNQ